MESEVDRDEIRALFGPPSPSLRSYLGLLVSRAWKRRGPTLRDASVAVLVLAVTTWWQVHRGIVKGSDALEIVVTTGVPALAIVLIYFLWEFIWTAYRIHQMQERRRR